MAKTQIDILADFIMSEIEGEPSQSEGAGDTAIRIIKNLQVRAKNCEYNFAVQVDETRKLQAENKRYGDVIERCIKAMEGSNCLELEWLKEALKKEGK